MITSISSSRSTPSWAIRRRRASCYEETPWGGPPFGDALAARPSVIPAGTAAEPDDPALVVYTSGTTGHHLAQEMNPLDDGFRQRTSAVFDTWRLAYTNALDRAKDDALVHLGIDTGDTALALVAQIEGTLSLARNSQDPDTLTVGSRSLRRYLDSMRGT